MSENQKPTRELTIGEIITQTFTIYSQKFAQYLIPFIAAGIITGLVTMAIYYIIKIPQAPLPPPQNATSEEIANWLSQLLSYLSATLANAILGGIIGWVISQITQGISVKFTADTLEKGTADLRTSLNYTMQKLLSLLAVSIITGMLIILGIIAFIIPGIILAIIFSLVVPTIIIENTGTLESLSRSRLLVSHRWLKTLALLLLLYLIILIAEILIGTIILPFGEAAPLASGILASFVQPILPIGLTLYYYSMIARATPRENKQTIQTS